jgi:hypothetical protein
MNRPSSAVATPAHPAAHPHVPSLEHLLDELADEPELLLTTDEAACYLGVTRGALDVHRHRGTGPAYLRTPQGIRYSVADLDDWLAPRRVVPVRRTPDTQRAPAAAAEQER